MTQTISENNRELSSFSDEELTSKEQSAIAGINKDLASFLIAETFSDGAGGSIDFAEVLTQSLAADDPELAAQLKEVLRDPDVVAAFDAYQRVTAGNATQDDIDLLRAESEFAGQAFENVSERDPNNPDAGRGRLDAATQERVDIIDSVVGNVYQTPDNPGTPENIFTALGANSAGSFGFLATANGIFDNVQSEYYLNADTVNTSAGTLAATSGLFFGGRNLYNGIAAAQKGDDLNASLDITVGALGITRGLQSLSSIVVKKVAAKIGTSTAGAVSSFLAPNAAAAAGSALGKAGAAFAIGIGSAVAVAAGTASLVRNAMAADEARRSGQHGVAAIYGTQAALDGVSTVLNVASLVADFVPGPGTVVSILLDSVNLVLTGVNIGLSFLVDLVADKDKLQRTAWDNYLKSPAFNSYIDGIGDSFAKEGYDKLTVYVDSATSGVPDYGTGNVLQNQAERSLTQQAKDFPGSDELRVAILDQTQFGKTLTGRDNDDYLDGGRGDDTLYGKGGNDLLFGGTGNDTLEGGPGDDLLLGGAGYDTLKGGPGNDALKGYLGADINIGGSGDDRIDLEVGADRITDGGDGDDLINLIVNDEFDLLARYGGSVDTDLNTQISRLNFDRERLVNDIKSIGAFELLGLKPNKEYPRSDPRIKSGESFNGIFDFSKDYSANSQISEEQLKEKGYVFVALYEPLGAEQSWNIFYNFESDTIAGVSHNIATGKLQSYLERDNVSAKMTEAYYDGWYLGRVGYLVALGSGALFDHSGSAYFHNNRKFSNEANLSEFTDIENVVGTRFTDNITGDDGDNYLDGGKTILNSGAYYTDTVSGKGGDDVIVYNNIGDHLDGGTGHDTLVVKFARQFSHGERWVYDLGNSTNYHEVQADSRHQKNLLNFESFSGSYIGEIVYGTGADNYLIGNGGDDTLHGRDGNDYLVADSGNDELFGDAGNDVLVSGDGNNILNGGDGTDTVVYDKAVNLTVDLKAGTASSETGTDTLSNIENIRSGEGIDTLYGDDNNNTINGGGIIDNLYGRGGDDTFVFNVKNYRDDLFLRLFDLKGYIDGGDGTDTLDYSDFKNMEALSSLSGGQSYQINLRSGSASFILDENAGKAKVFHKFNNIENIVAVNGRRTTIIGNEADNTVIGNSTDTGFSAGAGNDTFLAHKGKLLFLGGDGTDTLSFARLKTEDLNGEAIHIELDSDGRGNGTAFASGVIENGNPFFETNLSSVENATGHEGVDHITGSGADNILNGIGGNDTIYGKEGNDTLIAKGGKLYGGKGKDTYIVSADADYVQLKDANPDARFGGNHIVFQGLDADDVSVSISPYNDSIDFTREVDGKTKVLASWDIRTQDLDFYDWGPLFKALNQTIERVSFLDSEGNVSDTFTQASLQKFFYDQLVVTDSNENIFDFRGRDVKYNADHLNLHGIFTGSKGDDILDASATSDNVILTAEKGQDILIGGKGQNTFRADKSAESAVINATQGSGTIDLQNQGSVVFISSESGNYTIKDTNSGAADGTLIFKDFSYESIAGVTQDEKGLSILLRDGQAIDIKANTSGQLSVSKFKLRTGEVLTADEFKHQYKRYLEKRDAPVNGDASDNVIAVDHLGREYYGRAGDDTFVVSDKRISRDNPETKIRDVKGKISGGDGIDTVNYSKVEANHFEISISNVIAQPGTVSIKASVNGIEVHTLDGIENIIGARDSANTIRRKLPFGLFGDKNNLSESELSEFREDNGSLLISPDLAVTGGNLDDIIFLGAGDDTLAGLGGNDNLRGGVGNDTYNFDRDFGRDTILDAGGDHDALNITGLSLNELIFRQQGDDLVITQLEQDSADTIAYASHGITVTGQFKDKSTRKIEHISVNGETLSSADISLLVQATAAFLAQNGGDDSSGSPVIGDNHHLLSQISVSALA